MNGDREGIDRLRDAVETVAREIEERAVRKTGRSRGLVWAAAAAVVVLALAAGLTLLGPNRDPDVEVRVLKVRGHAVRARLVRGETPSTILVVPESPSSRLPVASAAIPGGMP